MYGRRVAMMCKKVIGGVGGNVTIKQSNTCFLCTGQNRSKYDKCFTHNPTNQSNKNCKFTNLPSPWWHEKVTSQGLLWEFTWMILRWWVKLSFSELFMDAYPLPSRTTQKDEHTFPHFMKNDFNFLIFINFICWKDFQSRNYQELVFVKARFGGLWSEISFNFFRPN